MNVERNASIDPYNVGDEDAGGRIIKAIGKKQMDKQ